MQKDTPGIRIDIVDENLTISEILEGVANNTFDVAIADSNIVKEVLAYLGGLKVAVETATGPFHQPGKTYQDKTAHLQGGFAGNKKT